MPWSVPWSISLDGVPASDSFNPYLISIDVEDRDGGTSDTATLVFDDEGGQMVLPQKGSVVSITLDGVAVFEGKVDEPRSSGSREGGMKLTVTAKGVDTRSKSKQVLDFHKDDCTLEDFLKEAGKRGGVKSVKVDKELGKLKRKFWAADGESFLHLGQRLADELGATFKLKNGQAVFAKRGAGMAPGGAALPSVTAERFVNLLDWDIAPFNARPRFAKARAYYFDRKSAERKQKDVEIGERGAGGDGDEVVDVLRFPKADEESADAAAKGRKAESEREGGNGTVTLLLAAEARVEGTLTLIGARPGIDGTYRIVSVHHTLTRDNGGETKLDLKQPQGDAGSDTRGAGK